MNLPIVTPARRPRRFAAMLPLLAVAILLAAPRPRAAAQAGRVDPGFSQSLGLGGGVNSAYVQADGSIIVGGVFPRQVARLKADGNQDAAFSTGNQGPSGYFEIVSVVVPAPGGGVLVGGHFATLAGRASVNLGRLKADGTPDDSFRPGAGPAGDRIGQPNVAGAVNAIVVNPVDGKIYIGGNFTSFNGVPRGSVARLNADGSLDPSFDPARATGNGQIDSDVGSLALQDDGKLVVGSSSGVTRLNADGSLDGGFRSSQAGFNSGFQVKAVALQDGKILVGGYLTREANAGTARVMFRRLNPDGSPDAGFNPAVGTGGDVVSENSIAILVQPDGKILVGGAFAQINGATRGGLARLNADGSLDAAFNAVSLGAAPVVRSLAYRAADKKVLAVANQSLVRLLEDGSADAAFVPASAPGPNGGVTAFSRGSDGKILLAGYFTAINGVARLGIARLEGDGGFDPSFHASILEGQSAYGVFAVVGLPNGKLLIGGQFNANGSVNLARLNANGDLDSSFNAGNAAAGTGGVGVLAVQPDGKILVGGQFAPKTGAAGTDLVRLNPDGSLDRSFNAGTALGGGANELGVFAMALQPDGKVLVGGSFTRTRRPADGGTPGARDYVVRLNRDGSVDANFDAGTFGTPFNLGVRAVLLQRDGRVVIGGDFDAINGTPRHAIARLNPDGSLDAGFSPGTGFRGTTPVVSALAAQGDTVVAGGLFNAYNDVPVGNVVRLLPDGTLDRSFNTGGGTDNIVNALLVQPEDNAVLLGGNLTVVSGANRNFAARLLADGTLDTGFNPGAGTSRTEAVGVHAGNGRVLIGGSLGLDPRLGGDGTRRIYLARLNPDGSTDTQFHPGLGPDGVVSAVLAADDGSAVIGGEFTSYDGQPAPHIARIHFDGSLDRSFRGEVDAPVRALAQLPAGKLALGGEFNRAGGRDAHAIAVVEATTGAPDPGFSSTGASGPVYALAADEGGRLLVGGLFDSLGGADRANLGRLNADGTDDASFDPGDFDDGVNRVSPAFSPVPRSVLPQPHRRKKGTNGAVTSIVRLPAPSPTSLPSTYVAGSFSQVGANTKATGVAKLDTASGQPDPDFQPGGVNGIANARPAAGEEGASRQPRASGGVPAAASPAVLAIRATTASNGSGKLILGGRFSSVGGKPRQNVARINADTGSLDLDFDPGAGADGEVHTLSVQPDGKTIIGGTFSQVDTQPRSAVARLLGDVGVAPAGPPFFAGATDVGGGFSYLPSFGYFKLLPDNPGYVYHNDLGFLYFIDANDGKSGIYLYDFATPAGAKSLGFLYTSPSFPFPYLYSFDLGAFLYYFPDQRRGAGFYTTAPRIFSRLDTGEILFQ